MRRAIRTALCSALLAACSGETTDPGVTVRDSAGITIVENTTPLWTAETAWHLEATPSLAIGVVEGPPEYQLYRVRGALRLDDGTIVVADGGSRQIRFYDAAGTHIRSVGGEGDGPGEYRVPGLLARYPGDSLIIWDGNLQRGTVLTLGGELARTFNGPVVGTPFYYVHGVFGDGSIFGRLDEGVGLDTVEQGLQRYNATYFRMDPAAHVDTVGVFFGNEALTYTTDRGGTALTSMPFGRDAAHATWADLLHFGTSDTWEIRTYTSAGVLVRVSRNLEGNRPLSQELVDTYTSEALARITDPSALRRREAMFDQTPWPATLPAYSDLKADTEGNLWVADYRAPGEEQPRWTVLDAEGHMLGTIETPIGFTIYDIGSDYLLGVEPDELGVERVVFYRLIKP